jgi:hypothetical protein
MIIQQNTKTNNSTHLNNKTVQHNHVTSYELSNDMIQLYNALGIFASEEPVKKTVQKLVKLDPKLICPMHGSAFDSSIFPKYVDALMNERYAFSNKLLGKELEEKPITSEL